MYMKKIYNQPDTHIQQIGFTNTICVGSITSNAGLEFGGGSDGTNENERPF